MWQPVLHGGPQGYPAPAAMASRMQYQGARVGAVVAPATRVRGATPIQAPPRFVQPNPAHQPSPLSQRRQVLPPTLSAAAPPPVATVVQGQLRSPSAASGGYAPATPVAASRPPLVAAASPTVEYRSGSRGPATAGMPAKTPPANFRPITSLSGSQKGTPITAVRSPMPANAVSREVSALSSSMLHHSMHLNMSGFGTPGGAGGDVLLRTLPHQAPQATPSQSLDRSMRKLGTVDLQSGLLGQPAQQQQILEARSAALSATQRAMGSPPPVFASPAPLPPKAQPSFSPAAPSVPAAPVTAAGKATLQATTLATSTAAVTPAEAVLSTSAAFAASSPTAVSPVMAASPAVAPLATAPPATAPAATATVANTSAATTPKAVAQEVVQAKVDSSRRPVPVHEKASIRKGASTSAPTRIGSPAKATGGSARDASNAPKARPRDAATASATAPRQTASSPSRAPSRQKPAASTSPRRKPGQAQQQARPQAASPTRKKQPSASPSKRQPDMRTGVLAAAAVASQRPGGVKAATPAKVAAAAQQQQQQQPVAQEEQQVATTLREEATAAVERQLMEAATEAARTESFEASLAILRQVREEAEQAPCGLGKAKAETTMEANLGNPVLWPTADGAPKAVATPASARGRESVDGQCAGQAVDESDSQFSHQQFDDSEAFDGMTAEETFEDSEMAVQEAVDDAQCGGTCLLWELGDKHPMVQQSEWFYVREMLIELDALITLEGGLEGYCKDTSASLKSLLGKPKPGTQPNALLLNSLEALLQQNTRTGSDCVYIERGHITSTGMKKIVKMSLRCGEDVEALATACWDWDVKLDRLPRD
eukprot:TRINITY_DN1657_c1_g1_i1.p1 TRINITY_DN1657_c1_g1~~TRINITY_DN1657_c1_g1_i1.p1  ORF type:complete len:828 (-),score=201.71 TRINITY_DN1657_c1_g1_i1:208-2691(-)